MKKKVLFGIVILVAILFAAGRVLGGRKPAETEVKPLVVEKGDVSVSVIESGTIDAVKAVEVKPRVSGRLAKLLVDEGSVVSAGQLIAIIDPQEAKLKVEQDQAQLTGAQSAVARGQIEIEQRRKTAIANLRQAEARVAQLRSESKSQPALVSTAIQSAKANLQSAVRERERLVSSAHPNSRAQAKATLDEAQKNYENAVRQLARQVDLEEKGYISTRDLDNARLSVDVAQARLRSAKEAFDRQEAQLRAELDRAEEAIRAARAEVDRTETNQYLVGNKQEELKSALAEVEKARAALRDPEVLAQQVRQSQSTVTQLTSVLKDSRRALSETEIRAPISGIVTKKYLQVGELAAGQSQFQAGSPVVRIEDRSKMRVKIAINEIDVAKLSLGMPARVRVDALPGKDLSGQVSKIAPASKDTGSATQSADSVVRYEVEVVLKDIPKTLRSGMSAKCFIDVISHKGVIAIPVEYVTKDETGVYVYVAPTKPTDKTQKKKVAAGPESGSKIEIVSGLALGEKLVKPDYNGPARKGFMQMGPDGDDGP